MSKSGFQDSFQKDNTGEENLDFDNSAFYYFSFSILVVALIPSTWYYILRPLIYGEVAIDREEFQNCQCDKCKERLKSRKNVHRWDFFSQGFIIKALIIVFGWVLLFKCWLLVKDLEPLKGFVPHELLGVSKSASVKEVKKAYRKLSKVMHPDKNPENPNAIEEFLQITKAHQILTDPISRDNFQKYGHPEGPNHQNVGIALPETLSRKDQQVFVLVMFLLGFNAINAYFYFDLTKEETDLGGVNKNNREIFNQMIDHDTMGRKSIPGILGQGVELKGMKCRNKKEFEIVKRLREHPQIKGCLPKSARLDDKQEMQVKPVCFIMAHAFNLFTKDEQEDPGIQEDLDTLMKLTPSYIDIMVEEVLKLIAMVKAGVSYKRVSGHNALGILQFSQNMIQNGFENPDPYSQLPDMKDEDVKKLKTNNDNMSFYDFVTLEEEKRNEILKKTFDDAYKVEQLQHAILGLPVAKLSATAVVEGSIDIAIDDILTITIRVDFPNLQKWKTTGYICSNRYKYLRRDGWYMIVTDKSFGGIAMVQKIDIEKEFFEHKIQEKLQREGDINFVVLLVNDSYKGLDLMDEVFIKAEKEKSHTWKEYEYLEFDKMAIKQSSNILTPDPVLGSGENSDSDQDEDKKPLETDEEELIRRLKFVKLNKASEHLVEAQKVKKIEDKEKEEKEEKRVTLKSEFDPSKEARKQLKEDSKKNPFVPFAQMSIIERKALISAKKEKIERDEKVKKADEQLMSTARDPVPMEAYLQLAGYFGVAEELVAFVPATPWHMSNTYFDGIKYTGPLNQNPINPLTVEQWFEDFTKAIAERKKLAEFENARAQAEMDRQMTALHTPGKSMEEIEKSITTSAEAPIAESGVWCSGDPTPDQDASPDDPIIVDETKN